MNSSYLRVILLLGAINVVVSLSITKSITRSSSFRRSSSASFTAFHIGHMFQISKGLCPGCDHDALQFLFRHNLVRAQRFEPPLMWDRKLQSYAQGWANQRKADCALRHSFSNGQFNLGENIYMGFGANWTPADAVVAWASEKRHYNYGSNTCDPGQMCGHYTQIVWKNTRRVGCARVVCNSGKIFMTCNYDPPGNYIGQKPY